MKKQFILPIITLLFTPLLAHAYNDGSETASIFGWLILSVVILIGCIFLTRAIFSIPKILWLLNEQLYYQKSILEKLNQIANREGGLSDDQQNKISYQKSSLDVGQITESEYEKNVANIISGKS